MSHGTIIHILAHMQASLMRIEALVAKSQRKSAEPKSGSPKLSVTYHAADIIRAAVILLLVYGVVSGRLSIESIIGHLLKLV